MDGPKIIENLFYAITIISTFNCIVRSDYNFAFGLLSFYMLRTAINQDKAKQKSETDSDTIKTCKIVSKFAFIAPVIVVPFECRSNHYRHNILPNHGQRLVGEASSQREDLEVIRFHPDIDPLALMVERVHQRRCRIHALQDSGN